MLVNLVQNFAWTIFSPIAKECSSVPASSTQGPSFPLMSRYGCASIGCASIGGASIGCASIGGASSLQLVTLSQLPLVSGPKSLLQLTAVLVLACLLPAFCVIACVPGATCTLSLSAPPPLFPSAAGLPGEISLS